MNVPKGIVLPNCHSDSYWFAVVSLLINVLKFSNLIMSDPMEYMILLTIMHNLNQFFYVTEDKKVIEYQLFINLPTRKKRNRFRPFRLISAPLSYRTVRYSPIMTVSLPASIPLLCFSQQAFQQVSLKSSLLGRDPCRLLHGHPLQLRCR